MDRQAQQKSITLSIYRIGFEDMKFGYAISQAMIVAVIIAVISITQIRFTDKRRSTIKTGGIP
ncbi:MAG: hypothetical protein ACLSHX_14630 [Suilimivivens sp.]